MYKAGMQVLGFMAGALHGGAVGGGLGSVVPGVGTAVGAAAVGLAEGTAAAIAIGELVDATYYLNSDNDGPSNSGASEGSAQPQYKVPRPGASGKAGATDAPSWAKGQRPLVGESGKSFARRLLDEKYGAGKWKTGPASEFNQLQKYADRHFMDPPPPPGP